MNKVEKVLSRSMRAVPSSEGSWPPRERYWMAEMGWLEGGGEGGEGGSGIGGEGE